MNKSIEERIHNLTRKQYNLLVNELLPLCNVGLISESKMWEIVEKEENKK